MIGQRRFYVVVNPATNLLLIRSDNVSAGVAHLFTEKGDAMRACDEANIKNPACTMVVKRVIVVEGE